MLLLQDVSQPAVLARWLSEHFVSKRCNLLRSRPHGSDDPQCGSVAQMILFDIRSASVSDDTLLRHTALVPPKSNTEALYNLLMSHKVGQRWGQRRRSGFRFCWLISFGRGVIVWDRVALRLVKYFEKRVVRRSWFEIGDSSLTDRTGEGGADHLEQRRSNPLIIGKKNLASYCHRDHHHHDCFRTRS